MKLKFLELKTTVKSKFNQFFPALNQRHYRKVPVLEFEVGCIMEEQDVFRFYKNRRINLIFCRSLGKILQLSCSRWLQQRKILP